MEAWIYAHDDQGRPTRKLVGHGKGHFSFPIEHCLEGLWQDGPRKVRIRRQSQLGYDYNATLVSGRSPCGKKVGDVVFGFTLNGDRIVGTYMVGCEPKRCVRRGGQRRPFNISWRAKVSPNGKSLLGKWEQIMFDVYRRGGQISCRQTGRTKWLPLNMRRIGHPSGPGRRQR